MKELSRKDLAKELRKASKEENYFWLKRYAVQAADELEKVDKPKIIIKDRPKSFLIMLVLVGAIIGASLNIMANHTILAPDYKCFGNKSTFTCHPNK